MSDLIEEEEEEEEIIYLRVPCYIDIQVYNIKYKLKVTPGHVWPMRHEYSLKQ